MRIGPREREVLDELLLGYTSKEIGARLFMSSETARTHSQVLMRKTRSRSRVALAVWWFAYRIRETEAALEVMRHDTPERPCGPADREGAAA